jgi:pilus assembly protein CpaF
VVINRIEKRFVQKQDKKDNQTFISVYDVVSRIADEVVKYHKDLIVDITLSKSPKSALEKVILKIINEKNYKVAKINREELIKEVTDHILGYGILQKYIDLPDFSDAYINSPDNIWIKCGDKMERVNESFGSNENLLNYIQTTIQANLKGEINENKALVKFEDKEKKLRIICGISPVTTISPTIVIRKHREDAYTLEDLIKTGMLNRKQAEDLVRYAKSGANIMFVGKGGTGKTTLMRAVLEELEEERRILVMEEHPELFLKHPNAVHTLVKRNEYGEIYGIRELSDMGLLMSIDVYVYGEIREGEAMTFFNGAFAGNQTFNTAHAGSGSSALRKMMINMKMSGTNLSDDVLLDILYESVNIIVYLDSFKIMEIVEVVSEEKEKYNYLWNFDVQHRETTFIQGRHKRVGCLKSNDMITKLGQNNLLEDGDVGGNLGNKYRVSNISRVATNNI